MHDPCSVTTIPDYVPSSDLVNVFKRSQEITKSSVEGVAKGLRYSFGLTRDPLMTALIRREQVLKMVREVFPGPKQYLSMTLLRVESGAAGMPSHVDYPHMYPGCSLFPLQCMQFSLSLDGTEGGVAPLWLGTPDNTIEQKPGELIVFPGHMNHGVHPNVSGRSRTSLLWSIGRGWIKPMMRELWDWSIDDQDIRDLMRD